MTAQELKDQLVGKTIENVEYEDGADTAYLITKDGFGIEISVEPTYDEEE